MTIETLAAWILSVMMATVPPGRSTRPKEARETAAQGKIRYEAIANAIAKVSLDPKERPLYSGPQGREKTAALMLTISLHESHWRRDVDLGLGPKAHGGGRYWCMMQIAVDSGKTPEGWTRKQLVQSRERCFRRGLHILQRGRKYCAKVKAKDEHAFVNHYASGYCDRGRKAVAKRIRTLRRLLKKHPLPAQKP